MKKVLSVWWKVTYGNGMGFHFWSSRINGEGDTNLVKGSPRSKWKKIIVLKPTGDPEASFSMGYCDTFGNAKISSARRKVKEGSFGMRMGPEDCEFFIASKKSYPVNLEFVEYADIDDKNKSDRSLY